VLLLWIVGAFAVGNAVTALIVSYEGLLMVRAVVGMGHGLMWSITAAIAVRLVSAQSAATATAAVFSGISLALVFGVPAGSALGEWAGWRTAFGVLAGATAAAWVAVYVLVPSLPAVGAMGLRQVAALMVRSGGLRVVLLITALIVMGNYAAYTYIAPILLGRGAPSSSIAVYLLVYGVMGIVGNAAAGVLLWSTRLSARMALIAAVALVAASLVVLAIPVTGPSAAVLIAVAVWGVSYSMLPVVLQTLVLRSEPHAHEAATSLYVMVFNISIAAGAFLGAIGISIFAPGGPALVGAACCGAAITCILAARRPTPHRRTQTHCISTEVAANLDCVK
jgi:predicted MFS family arabinose efflux permease